VTNWTAANPLRNHVTPNELEIGFVTLGNMRANGVRSPGGAAVAAEITIGPASFFTT
jgi:hypothetical protein